MGSIVGTVLDTLFGPPITEVPLTKSPLVFVVAQVRFERVASIGSESFIAGFQEAIRNIYPVMRREQEARVSIELDGQITTSESGYLWRFDERPEGWQVTLAPDFVALSTTRYTRRHDFLYRLTEVLSAVQRHLGIRFCERLGVRFVDRITEQALLDRLGELLRDEVLGTVVADTGPEGVELLHCFADTKYQLPGHVHMHGRWGLLPADATFDPAIPAAATRSWVLDLDTYTSEPTVFNPIAMGARANSACEHMYRFFRWAVKDDFLIAHGGQP